MKPFFKIILFFTFLALYCGQAKAQVTNFQAYSLFVMNIAKYTSWPENTTKFELVVVGKSKIYEELSKKANQFQVNGHPIAFRQVDNVADIKDAQIIYISDNKSSLLDEIQSVTDGKPVLLIGEREGLHKKGAGFSFVLTEDSKLRFDINNTELNKRHIKISKTLTSLANSII
ncbi:MAG: YfiR family protein [Cyclobacteriaceae bacterium]